MALYLNIIVLLYPASAHCGIWSNSFSPVSVKSSYLPLQKQPPEVFYEKGVLKNFAKFTWKHLSQSLFLIKLQACNFIKKDTLSQVFSCEFSVIFKNIFFTEYLRATASASRKMFLSQDVVLGLMFSFFPALAPLVWYSPMLINLHFKNWKTEHFRACISVYVKICLHVRRVRYYFVMLELYTCMCVHNPCTLK